MSTGGYGCPLIDCGIISFDLKDRKEGDGVYGLPPLEDGMADASSAMEAAISQ